jgi:hypothetical protein
LYEVPTKLRDFKDSEELRRVYIMKKFFMLQSEQCFFLDNSSACSQLPLYEEIQRDSSEYQLLEPAHIPEASLFLLPTHYKGPAHPHPPAPPPPGRSNRTFFTFHQRRGGEEEGAPSQVGRTGRRKPIATLDIRKAVQF